MDRLDSLSKHEARHILNHTTAKRDSRSSCGCYACANDAAQCAISDSLPYILAIDGRGDSSGDTALQSALQSIANYIFEATKSLGKTFDGISKGTGYIPSSYANTYTDSEAGKSPTVDNCTDGTADNRGYRNRNSHKRQANGDNCADELFDEFAEPAVAGRVGEFKRVIPDVGVAVKGLGGG